MLLKHFMTEERIKADIAKAFRQYLPKCPVNLRMEMTEKIYKEMMHENNMHFLVAPQTVLLRTAASFVRHRRTNYHNLIGEYGKQIARSMVNEQVDSIVSEWAGVPPHILIERFGY